MSLGVEFVGVQSVKNISMEVLEAGVKLLLLVGEGTVERWNLLIASRGLIRYMCSRNARPKKRSPVGETGAMCNGGLSGFTLWR